jgi:hypothetical protein
MTQYLTAVVNRRLTFHAAFALGIAVAPLATPAHSRALGAATCRFTARA